MTTMMICMAWWDVTQVLFQSRAGRAARVLRVESRVSGHEGSATTDGHLFETNKLIAVMLVIF